MLAKVDLTLCLLFQTVWAQIRSNQMIGLIWIQCLTVDDKKHANYPAGKELNLRHIYQYCCLSDINELAWVTIALDKHKLCKNFIGKS